VEETTDLADVRGQEQAKRALEIAAAGGHNLLIVGPPGSGKTMLARAFCSLLPDLDNEESLEVAALYSLRGALRERPPTATRPPFRAPHHSVSRAGLIGGGSGLARPGEISPAHRGGSLLGNLSGRVTIHEFRRPDRRHASRLVEGAGSLFVEWYENIKSVEWKSPKPIAVGSRIAFCCALPGTTPQLYLRNETAHPERTAVMSTAEGPFPVETTYTWDDTTSGGTRMTLRNRGAPAGFARVAAPMMTAAMRRANRKDLRRLKAILEARKP
jgi:energy-coupling factor transporter ATP-binding protein EcfA2